MQFDKNACPANEMSIKLRHGATNGKLVRTAYNLEQAAHVATVEALDLNGEQSAYAIMANLAVAYAEDKGWSVGHPADETAAQYAVGAAVEMIVNAKIGALTAKEIAEAIVKELRDMELIDG